MNGMKKILCIFLFVITITFSCLIRISAADLPQTTGVITQSGDTYHDPCGKGTSGCYGTHIKKDSSNIFICTHYSITSPAQGSNISCAKNSDWDEKTRYGVAKILNSAKPVILANQSNVTPQYFAAELAINTFLKQKNQGGDTISDSIITSNSKTLYALYLNAANNAYNSYDSDSAINIKLSASSLNFKINGSNYVSDTVTVSGVDNFNVKSNKGTATKTSSGNGFTVSIPVSSVTSKTSINVTITSTKLMDQARRYSCGSTYQPITPVATETLVKTDSELISGTITPKGKLTISKVDGNDKALAGATLKVTGPNKYSQEIVMSGTPVTLDNLDFGTYTISEIKAPSGYSLSKPVTVNLSATALSQTVKVKNEKTKVSISKLDVTGQKELPGATLEIQDKDGNVVKYCTDEEGNTNKECRWVSTDKPYEIEGLPTGEYYLVETIAPSGYVLSSEKVKFEVKDDGVLVKAKMENELIKIKIYKLDAAGKKGLKGATLEIQDKDGNVVKYCKDEEGNTNKECRWVSKEEPYEIEGLPAGEYYLVEVSAPEGYVLNKDKMKFVVANDVLVQEFEMENELEVEVPDTMSARSALLLTVAMIDIALGIGIITYVKKNKLEQ